MIRIGTFARISQVPVSTLRYYDEVGLLPAARVDEFTGYRYYALEQMPRLQRILALKEMGLPLEDIRALLERRLSTEELHRLLTERKAALVDEVNRHVQRLERLAAWLEQIEQEENMPQYDVVIKKVEPQAVISLRDVIRSYPEQGRLWDELDTVLSAARIAVSGPGVTVYHSDEPEIDVEVAVGLAKGSGASGLLAGERVRAGELPGIDRAATVIYTGPLERIGDGYRGLMGWIEQQGLKITGPAREVYLRGPTRHSQTDPGVVVEIQAPVG